MARIDFGLGSSAVKVGKFHRSGTTVVGIFEERLTAPSASAETKPFNT